MIRFLLPRNVRPNFGSPLLSPSLSSHSSLSSFSTAPVPTSVKHRYVELEAKGVLKADETQKRVIEQVLAPLEENMLGHIKERNDFRIRKVAWEIERLKRTVDQLSKSMDSSDKISRLKNARMIYNAETEFQKIMEDEKTSIHDLISAQSEEADPQNKGQQKELTYRDLTLKNVGEGFLSNNKTVEKLQRMLQAWINAGGSAGRASSPETITAEQERLQRRVNRLEKKMNEMNEPQPIGERPTGKGETYQQRQERIQKENPDKHFVDFSAEASDAVIRSPEDALLEAQSRRSGAEKKLIDPQLQKSLIMKEYHTKQVEKEFGSSIIKDLGPVPSAPKPPKSCYLFGSVGSGKTLLMQLLTSSLAKRLFPTLDTGSSSNLTLRPKTPKEAICLNPDFRASSAFSLGGDRKLIFQDCVIRQLHCNDLMRLVHQQSHFYSKLSTLERHQLGFRHVMDAVVAGVYGNDSLFASSNDLPADLIEKIHQIRSSNKQTEGDTPDQSVSEFLKAFELHPYSFKVPPIPLPPLLLCFDELQLHDVADATIFNGLFLYLIRLDAVMVITSNRHPDHLFQTGILNSDVLPLVNSLKNHCQVVQLGASTSQTETTETETKAVDYRLWKYSNSVEEGEGQFSSFFYGEKKEQEMQNAVLDLVHRQDPSKKSISKFDDLPWESTTIPLLFGRSLNAQKALPRLGIAHFSFQELCLQPLSAVDYLGLASHFHTLVISDIPRLSIYTKNQARRLISLIDEAYNHQIRIICTAQTPIEGLFEGASLSAAPSQTEGSEGLPTLSAKKGVNDPYDDFDTLEMMQFERGDSFGEEQAGKVAKSAVFTGETERFAFSRALSRLFEMQSKAYVHDHWEKYCHPL